MLTLTLRHGVQFSRDPRTGELVKRTRIATMQEAAQLASGGDIPHFFLFADLPTLKQHKDVLRMPWTTAKGKPSFLDLAQEGVQKSPS